jgi:hypothetical protein
MCAFVFTLRCAGQKPQRAAFSKQARQASYSIGNPRPEQARDQNDRACPQLATSATLVLRSDNAMKYRPDHQPCRVVLIRAGRAALYIMFIHQ